jgi:hypothetical protein
VRILALVIGMLGAAAQDAGDWQTARTQALEHRLAGRTPQAITLLEAAVARWPTEAGLSGIRSVHGGEPESAGGAIH